LRKYESATRVADSDPADPPIEFYSPFGPLIARFRLPAALVERINRHADARVSPDSGREFLLGQDFVFGGGEDSLAVHTERALRRYLARLEDTHPERIDFESFWVVSQYAGTPSPVHFHSGDLSGVLYLKVPEIDAAEEERTYIGGRQAGYINFLIGGKQRFSKSLASFRPEPGDFYLFPGWLLHVAEPFKGAGERRSMAFNAFVRGGE
jgi:hypothetical protein